MIIDLKQFFTAAKIARRLEVAPPIRTTVFDDLFPEATRQQYDSPVIPISDLKTVVGCVPIVQRGAESVPLTGTQLDISYIEPLPVRIHAPIRAVELNNLKLMDMGSRDDWANRKTLAMRAAVRATIEVLCAQAVFNGSIDYPLLQENGQFARYKVGYNGSASTHTVAAGDKWDAEGASLATVYLLLEDMGSALDDAGYGGEKITYVGKSAFAKLLALVEATDKPKIPVRINEDGTVNLGGHVIKKMAETYKDPQSGSATKKVPDKEIRMVSKGYAGFIYGPVDDLDARLQPMPLFVKPIVIQDPSQIRIVAESKPLPAVSPEATRKATVLS